MNLQQLAKINATTLRSAGPRYAPGIDAAAPNLQIESLILAIEGLLCGDRFQKRIVDLHGSLKEAWKAAQGHIQKPHRRKIQRADRLLNLFVKLKECPIGKGCSVVTRARAAAHKISLSLGNLDKAFYEEERKRRDAE